MYLFIGLDLQAGCKQNAFEIHLDVYEIYFRCNLIVFNPIQAGRGGHSVPPLPTGFFLSVLKRFAVG